MAHCRHQSLEIESMDDSSLSGFGVLDLIPQKTVHLKRSEMNALIMDYLIHEGFKEAAERFGEEAGIPPSILNAQQQQQQQAGTSSNDLTTSSMQQDTNNHTNGNSSCSIDNHEQLQDASVSSNNEISLADINNSNNDCSPSAISQQQQTSNASFANELRNSANSPDYFDMMPGSTLETGDMIDKRVEVRRHIQNGEIMEAKMKINLYYPELLDSHRDMYFKLQQQHMIELIKAQKIQEVLTYVHEHLNVPENTSNTTIERTLALLAYEDPSNSPYHDLLNVSNRMQLASEVNEIILKETTGNIETPKPRLVTLLKLLYWTQNELEWKKVAYPKLDDLFVEGSESIEGGDGDRNCHQL